MKNSFYEINQSMNLSVVENTNIDFIDLNEKDEELNIDLIINNNIELLVNFTILNFKKFNKSIKLNIIFEHPDATCKIYLNCLSIDWSTTNLSVNGICKQNINGYLDIKIDGVIDSDNAKIIGSPNFIFDTNKIDAHHSLTIGGVNPFQLDFLQSRNIEKVQAKFLLVTSKLFKCLTNLNEDIANKYKSKILSYWGS